LSSPTVAIFTGVAAPLVFPAVVVGAGFVVAAVLLLALVVGLELLAFELLLPQAAPATTSTAITAA